MVVPKDLNSEDAFDSTWPQWQEGMDKRCLVAVELEDSLDSLFKSLFQTHSTFQRKAQEARRYTQVEETNWTVNFSELPVSHHFQWNHKPKGLKEAAPAPGMMRKVLFSCPGNALHPGAFRTEQVERCVEYVPGRQFVVDVCVLSSPMYCDRFRPIVRYTGERLSATDVKLTIDYQIIYISKVNFMLKTFIERSARGGMEESFRKWLEALSHQYPSGVVDLLSPPKQRRTPKQKKKKDLKSHRLTDVPLEVVDEVEWEKSISSSSTISILLLTLLLTILRLIWLLVSIPSMVASALKSISRGVASHISWSLVFQAVLTLGIALLVHHMPPIPVSEIEASLHEIAASLHEAYSSPYGPPVCCTLFFFSGVFITRMMQPHPAKI